MYLHNFIRTRNIHGTIRKQSSFRSSTAVVPGITADAGGTKTYSLQDPVEGLTEDAVRTVMQKMIDKKAVASGEEYATEIKEAYIRISDREELA